MPWYKLLVNDSGNSHRGTCLLLDQLEYSCVGILYALQEIVHTGNIMVFFFSVYSILRVQLAQHQACDTDGSLGDLHRFSVCKA